MLAEFLEQEASQVKTAAAQFREIISTIDKVAASTAANVAGEHFAVSDFERPLHSRQESSPGGVTAILTAADQQRVAQATNNLHTEQRAPEPPQDGNSIRLSAQGDKSPFQPGPLDTDPAGSPVLKTAADLQAAVARLKERKQRAKEIGEALGVNWGEVDFSPKDLMKGMKVELEHNVKQLDVIPPGKEDLYSAKIALAHLEEGSDYYDRLEEMEEEMEEDAEEELEDIADEMKMEAQKGLETSVPECPFGKGHGMGRGMGRGRAFMDLDGEEEEEEKLAAAKPGGIIDRLRRGYKLGRSQKMLKDLSLDAERGGSRVRVKIRNKAGNVIDVIEPGTKADDPMVKWLSEAKGSGKAGEVGRHLGKHQEKYVTGGLVAGGTGAVAALAEREARKNREKTAGLKDRVADRLSKIRKAYNAGRARKGMQSVQRTFSDGLPRGLESPTGRVEAAVIDRTRKTTSTKGTGVLEDVAHHLGKHRTKYLAGGAAAVPTTALVAREKSRKGKTKEGSFEGAVEKMAAAGKVRTLEGWNKSAALKLPSAVMDAAKKARKVGKPAPLKQPKMNIISGFSTGRR